MFHGSVGPATLHESRLYMSVIPSVVERLCSMSSPGAGCPQGPQPLGSLYETRLRTYGQLACASCGSWAWRPPRSVVANHGVEDGQHLAHDGAEGGHVQHLAHTCAATGDMPAAVPLAAVILVGRHADQGTNLLARELAEFGQSRQQGAAAHLGDRRHGFEQLTLSLPDGRFLNALVDLFLDLLHLPFQEAHYRLD